MKKYGAVRTCFLLSLPFGVYGYWGMFTKSGLSYYDEMDGMYPFFALLFSGFIIAVGLIILVIKLIRRS